jgi:hypothetical protein
MGLLFSLGVVALLAAIWISLLFVAVSKARTLAESRALTVAARLNAGDRLGELNNMISYSRQLVFSSRQAHSQVLARYPHLEKLARVIIDDAREGARKVDEEREILKAKIVKEVKGDLQKNPTSAEKFLSLPAMQVLRPEPELAELGFISGIPSNARLSLGLKELREFDKAKGYTEKGSEFYCANLNALLPGLDSDLPFRFSSLPPPVGDTVAPLRLVREQVFKKLGLMRRDTKFRLEQGREFLPSAVHLKFVSEVSIGAGGFAQRQAISQDAVSCCNGAIEPK